MPPPDVYTSDDDDNSHDHDHDEHDDELREVCCHGGDGHTPRRVCCAAVCDDVLVWCTTAGELYAWRARTGAQPRCVCAALTFAPTLLGVAAAACVSQQRQRRQQRQRVVLVAPGRIVVGDVYMPDDDDDDEAVTAWSWRVRHEQRDGSVAWARATHVSVSPDGELATVATPTHLVLAWQSGDDDNDDGDNDVDDARVVSLSRRRGSAVSVVGVDCATWYGGGGDATGGGGGGCVRACAASRDDVFVLSRHGHLVRVALDRATRSVALQRDGHVLTRAHAVCAMAVSSLPTVKATATTATTAAAAAMVDAALLLVGLSDGVVLLLRGDTLTPFHRIDTAALLQRLPSSSSSSTQSRTQRAQRTQPGNGRRRSVDVTHTHDDDDDAQQRRVGGGVCDVAVGAHTLYIATRQAVWCVDRDSLTVDWTRTQQLVDGDKEDDNNKEDDNDDTGVFVVHDAGAGATDAASTKLQCASNGCWVAWQPHHRDDAQAARVRYFVTTAAAAAATTERRGRDDEANDDNDDDAADDCIHAHQPLPAHWLEPLLLPSSSSASASATTTTMTSRDARTTRAVSRTQPRPLVSLPVTFGHAIRSSGYGATPPWSVQRARKTAAQAKARQAAQCIGSDTATTTAMTTMMPRYRALTPYTAHPLCALAARNRVLARDARVHAAAVLDVAFAPLGDALVSVCHDGSAFWLRLPVAQHHAAGVLLRAAADDVATSAAAMKASSPAVTSSASSAALRASAKTVWSVDVSTSLRHPLVLTGASGGVLQLWQPSRRAATPYVTHHVTTTHGNGNNSNNEGNNTTATATNVHAHAQHHHQHHHGARESNDVRCARFFYLDTFVSYICGGEFALCRYAVDRGHVDALQRARNASRVAAPVFRYRAADAHSLTAMACINHFTSNTVVLATSSKALHVVDVATGVATWVAAQAHARTIHHIAMSRASRFVSSRRAHDDDAAATTTTTMTASDAVASPPPPQASSRLCAGDVAHLFATAALDGVVRLWDVRTPRAVRQWSLHRNRALTTTGLALSPTSAMLAVGSEDATVCVYDIGSNATAPLSTLPCDDVPTALAWHPIEATLAAGLASGRVVFFAQQP